MKLKHTKRTIFIANHKDLRLFIKSVYGIDVDVLFSGWGGSLDKEIKLSKRKLLVKEEKLLTKFKEGNDRVILDILLQDMVNNGQLNEGYYIFKNDQH